MKTKKQLEQEIYDLQCELNRVTGLVYSEELEILFKRFIKYYLALCKRETLRSNDCSTYTFTNKEIEDLEAVFYKVFNDYI